MRASSWIGLSVVVLLTICFSGCSKETSNQSSDAPPPSPDANISAGNSETQAGTTDTASTDRQSGNSHAPSTGESHAAASADPAFGPYCDGW